MTGSPTVAEALGSHADAVALVLVRDGGLPPGADETVAEAGGSALLVGRGVAAAGEALVAAERLLTAETSVVTPGLLARTLAPLLAGVHAVLLPGSPDGRDLAPRLAAALDRPLLAGAVRVDADGAEVLRDGGRTLVRLTAAGPFVATLEPGVRGVEPAARHAGPRAVELPAPDAARGEAVVRELLPPDPRTADLREAPRILGIGAGLADSLPDGRRAAERLREIGVLLGASVGATRVATDAGWLGHDRQIGTTGVVADPDLYIAFGVSGAAHHLGGLGRPRHVVSVNTDPSCPMTAMADLGIVADAPAVLTELARRLLAADHAQPEESHA